MGAEEDNRGVVVISQRIDRHPSRDETRDALDQAMTTWLTTAGYLPFPIPNLLDSRAHIVAWLEHLKPQYVVLSGGNDVGSLVHRDAVEWTLLEYAKANQLPLLGICRGMQMIAHYKSVPLEVVSGHRGSRHRITGEIQGEVNSYHQFGLSTCPDGYRILARSEDGCIEAIRSNEQPWEGWMWHPEREAEFTARDLERLRALFR